MKKTTETQTQAFHQRRSSGAAQAMEERVSAYLRAHPLGATRQEMASAFQVVPGSLTSAVWGLIEAGQVVRVGKRRNPETGHNNEVVRWVGGVAKPVEPSITRGQRLANLLTQIESLGFKVSMDTTNTGALISIPVTFG